MIGDHHQQQNTGRERRLVTKHRRLSSSGSSTGGSVISRVLGSFRHKRREEKRKKKSLDSTESQDDWASAAALYQPIHRPDRPRVDKRIKTILSDDEYVTELERMQERNQAHYEVNEPKERTVSRSSSQITDLPNFSYSSKSPKHRKNSTSTTSPTSPAFSAFPMFQGHEWPQPPRDRPQVPSRYDFYPQPQPQPQHKSQPPPQTRSVVSPISSSSGTIQVFNGCSNVEQDRGPIVRHLATTRPQHLLPRKAPAVPKSKPRSSPVPPPRALPSPSPLPSPPHPVTPHASPAPLTPPYDTFDVTRRGSYPYHKRPSSDLTLGDSSPVHSHRHSIYQNPNATTTGLLGPSYSPPTSPKTPAPPSTNRAERDAYFPEMPVPEVPEVPATPVVQPELLRMCPWPGCSVILQTEQEKADNLCECCQESLYPRESAFFGGSPHVSTATSATAAKAIPVAPAKPQRTDSDTLKALVGTKISLAENVKVNRAPRGSVRVVNSRFGSMSGFKLQSPPLGKRARAHAQAQAQSGQMRSPNSPASSNLSPTQTRRPSEMRSSTSSQPRTSFSQQSRTERSSNASGKQNDHERSSKHQSALIQPLSPHNASGQNRGKQPGFQDVRWEPPSPEKPARQRTPTIKFKPVFKSSYRPDPYMYMRRISRYSSRSSKYSRTSHYSRRSGSPDLSDGSWATASVASSSDSEVDYPQSQSHSHNRKQENGHSVPQQQLRQPPLPQPQPQPQSRPQRPAAPEHKESHHVQFAVPTRRPSLSNKGRPSSQLIAVRQERPQLAPRDTVLYEQIEDIIDCYTMGGSEENDRRKAENIASFFSKEPDAIQMRRKGFI
ncbi:hypothetical protein F4806DRAFT_388220 [Annulohypoxylon nitens]|nr:hypothetical protein F4806DRAFT_388220 [Annulohypoxylon nitens]